MTYRDLFERTVERLRACGIVATLEFGPVVSAFEIRRFEQSLNVQMPRCLVDFYLNVGDGVKLEWNADGESATVPFCRFSFPNLGRLVGALGKLRMESECLANHSFWEACDPVLARRHYERQLSFFPFFEENTDLICIEPVSDAEVVVYYQYDWSFMETGDSGIRLAGSLREFLSGWSTVAFVEPGRFWWPDTVANDGVIWSGEAFPFHLPSGS
jgi:hypothetical protein